MFKLLIIILSSCSFSWVSGEELSLQATLYFTHLKCLAKVIMHFIALYCVLLVPLIFYLFKWFQLVFSSSATVYGWPKEVPCTEEFPLSAMNPYGRTKV